MTRISFGALFALSIASAFAATWPFRGELAQGIANRTMHRPLVFAKSWRYQRGPINFSELSTDTADLLVIDEWAKNLSRDGVSRLKVRADGRRRLVVGTLSVGEDHEPQPHHDLNWTVELPDRSTGPHCLEPNSRTVRYWMADWKDRLYRGPWSQLEQLIAAGFDGAYLDDIDVFGRYESERASARIEMITLVQELAVAARREKSGFLIISHNADALLANPEYRLSIDAIAKSDLLFGLEGTDVRNTPGQIQRSMALLRLLQRDGKPVFVIEHMKSPQQIDGAAAELRRRGFVPAFEPRDRIDGEAPATRLGMTGAGDTVTCGSREPQ